MAIMVFVESPSGDAKEIGSTAHSRFQLQSSLAVREQMGVLWG